VTGGTVYRGKALPEFAGIYLFGDFCSGTIWGLLRDNSQNWQGKVLLSTPYKISAFGSDENGEIYLLDLQGGLYRLTTK
jgi:hypothetical protein